MKKLFLTITVLGVFCSTNAGIIEAKDIDLSKNYHIATIMSYRVYDKGYYYDNRPRYYKKVRYYKKPVYVHKKKRHTKHYKVPKVRVVVPVLTNNMKVQLALKQLDFYRGKVNGNLYSYETKQAIKKMHKEYQSDRTSYLDPKEKDALIYLGTLFNLNKILMSKGTDERSHYRRIQAALKIEGFYHGKIDGIAGSNTRNAIYSYKDAKGLAIGYRLSFKEESDLLNNAKALNDQNIEDTISSSLDKSI